MPSDKTTEHFSARTELYKSFDKDGNDLLDKQEVFEGIKEKLQLNDIFNLEDCVTKAFNLAKDKIKNKNN